MSSLKASFLSKEVLQTFRRYIVLSMFDGALGGYGIIAGNFFGGYLNRETIVSSVMGMAIALAISSALAAYEAEKSALENEVGDFTKNMFEIIYELRSRMRKRLAIATAVIAHTLSPLIPLFTAIVPYFVVSDPYAASVYALFALTFYVFLFGAFLGAMRRANPWLNGLRYLALTFLLALICSFLGAFI